MLGVDGVVLANKGGLLSLPVLSLQFSFFLQYANLSRSLLAAV